MIRSLVPSLSAVLKAGSRKKISRLDQDMASDQQGVDEVSPPRYTPAQPRYGLAPVHWVRRVQCFVLGLGMYVGSSTGLNANRTKIT